ncbi:acetyltransferase [Photobacterium sagamiensis]|uniref:acetyltransferase n=1 Tax=Photobacterium sagamiensis TaxID=2910241 RepID=UPI003D0C26C4
MIIQQENVIPTDITLIGAGGQAKVVADVILNLGVNRLCIIDSSPTKVGDKIQNIQVSLLDETSLIQKFHIAIGDNKVRSDLYSRYRCEAEYISVISPYAYIASTATVNCGSFVAAKAVVSADSKIDLGCIINHGAIIEHDCLVGQFCHVAPNATLLGGVTLGDRVFVGSGATILPGVKVADDVTIGAGAVVLSDILDSCTVVGLPAKRI